MANLSRSIPAARGLQGIDTFLWTISSQLRRIPLNWLDCPGRFFWVRFLSGLLMFSSLEVLRSTQESTMLNILMSVELLHSQFLNKAVRHAWVLLRLWWPLKCNYRPELESVCKALEVCFCWSYSEFHYFCLIPHFPLGFEVLFLRMWSAWRIAFYFGMNIDLTRWKVLSFCKRNSLVFCMANHIIQRIHDCLVNNILGHSISILSISCLLFGLCNFLVLFSFYCLDWSLL